MSKPLNYRIPFSMALQEIKNIGDPRSMKPRYDDPDWNNARGTALFDFKSDISEKQIALAVSAKNISISIIREIICAQIANFGLPLKMLDISFKPDHFSQVYYVIYDTRKEELLFFREFEDSPLKIAKWFIEENVNRIMKKYNVSKCKHIYFMLGDAYYQIANHNDDVSDPGRGYNFFSLKWFFENYFGVSEYKAFSNALKEYVTEVKGYIDYIRLSLLTPKATISLRKKIEQTLKTTDYEKVLNSSIGIVLGDGTIQALKHRFSDDKVYLVMLGNHDFAESLLTAEWLYDSMHKAKAVDLTVVGMGYLKAVEQLLYELICLHSEQGFKIQEAGKERGCSCFLNNYTIKEKMVDSTIGSMAYFYLDNPNTIKNHSLLNRSVETDANRIIKIIKEFAKIRNGYFHKDNITEWNKIKEIRDISLCLMFVLLGAHELTDTDLQLLGIPPIDMFTDYYFLCEYVHYHRGELFVFVDESNEESYYIGCYDDRAELIDGRAIKYSGAFFKEIGQGSTRYHVQEEETPYAIYLGKIVISGKESFELVRATKVYEDGRFVGPSIAEEGKIDY